MNLAIKFSNGIETDLVLNYRDASDVGPRCTLIVDASLYGLGAVIAHNVHGAEKVIVFGFVVRCPKTEKKTMVQTAMNLQVF